jgi:ribulose-5-phosphate 4-epimerase/fuculose-1-phosphate aldolase/alpha-ketoglutarate-dependent taurine dioxygenase
MQLKSQLLQSLKNTIPKAVKIDSTINEQIIEGNSLGTKYVQITSQDATIDLVIWAREHDKYLNELYQKYGAVLFRGFLVTDDSAFQALCQSFTNQLLDYTEPSTPRTKVNDKVYTSTEYPKDQFIPMHNEHSYTKNWPQKIWFYCKTAADLGGETPIADSALVYNLLPVAIQEKFEDAGITYVRNFHKGIDLSWQLVFGSDDKLEVEEHCRKNAIEFKWFPEDSLQTRSTAQAVVKHPLTDEKIWFNQAHLFNLKNQDSAIQEYMNETFGDRVPRNSYCGDGSPITQEDFDIISSVFEKAKIVFKWESGDVLWLDNMRFAHGRHPFEGDRKVLVAMSDSYAYKFESKVSEAAKAAIASARKQTSSYFLRSERPQTKSWLRYRLAGLYRILAMEKLDEGISGHISFKVPGEQELFWVNPFGLFFEEVTPDNLIMVDMAGNVVEGNYPVNVAGFCIHAAIHAARPDVHCIVHTHSPMGTVFTSLGLPIKPIDQTSCMFFEKHTVYNEYNGPVLSDEEGKNLVNHLGDSHTLLLRNHGTLTLGEELETAAMLMIAAEHSFQVNIQAHAIGKPFHVDPEVARATEQWIANPLGMRIEFDAYLRKAERLYPDLLKYRPE